MFSTVGKLNKFCFHFLLIILWGNLCIAQNLDKSMAEKDSLAVWDNYFSQYDYLSPLPNSINNSVKSSIIIKQGSFLSRSSLDEGAIKVTGTKSGKISGRLILSSDRKTIIFMPYKEFQYGEKVEVSIGSKIILLEGIELLPIRFSFTVEPNDLLKYHSTNKNETESVDHVSVNHVDAILPKIKTAIYNESAIAEGKIFLSAYGVIDQSFQSNPSINSSVLVVNNDGSIFYSKDIGTNKGAGLTDFKMHGNGLMSYPKVLKNYQWTGGAEVIHMVMDKSFAVVDSFQMGNGYTAETHDFHLLPNGHSLLMAYYLVPIDLSKVVPGSHPDAQIDGAVIQELDADKNVVFQWRTWDYINPSIIPWNLVPGNKQQIINVFHLNSIGLDNDGNLLLGTPGMGLKVSRQTGKILWIIGGLLNQFQFTNVATQEGLGDFGGHTFQRLDNGNIIVFDNSPFPWQPGYGTISSEVVEYKINEELKTAELVWKYIPEKVIPGWHAGSVQRLANGNTLICWGGPPNSGNIQLPIVTEVTQKGEKVFELFYEGNDLESYRAFRYLLNDGLPNCEIIKAEVMALNTYEFKDNNKIDPGISIKINELNSLGYNELIIKNYSFAPNLPEFSEKAPIVLPRRIVLSGKGILKINGEIRFDIKNWGVEDPSNTIIYHRLKENKGLFLPLETTYNFVTGKLTAKTNDFGEFILGKRDLTSQNYEPIPNFPTNNSKINYKIPVQLSWSPVGFVTSYALQVSLDANFSSLLINEFSIKEATYKLVSLLPNTTYYWRVSAQNDVGISKWCTTQVFNTVNPTITLKKPNGKERWHIGLEYYIEWDTNISDDVNVSLLKNGAFVKNISTSGNRSYLWDIELKCFPADDYKIKISSTADSTLNDLSDENFSIIDTISTSNNDKYTATKFSLSQNYPNPFNSSTIINYEIPESNYTTIIIYNSLGQKISVLVNEVLPSGNYSVNWNADNLPSGIYYYRMISGKYFQTKKLQLIK